jgi:hypothetical protein
MRFSPVLLFLSLAISVQAQNETDSTSAVIRKSNYDSLRSQYIKSFPNHFFVWPVLKQRRLDFEMNSLLPGGAALTYKSNKPYSIGVGLYLFELGVELAGSIPLDEQSKRIYGASDASDLQLNIIGKKWGIEGYIQNYQGFYIEDPDVEIPSGEPYPQRADIETRQIGSTVNYTFNNKKFSFRSVYNFADRQLRSAGSMLVFGSISGFRAQGDSAIIDPSYAADFGDAARVKKIRSTALAIAPGYTYNLIYRGFFLNGTLAVGPAHNWLYYETDDGRTKNDIKFDFFVVGRIGVGYNGDRIFGGLSFSNQGRSAKFENVEMVSTSGTFKVMIGYRFLEFGILKKRVWDIPKELFK